MEAQGYYAETFPRQAPASAAAGATGVAYFMAVGLLAGDVVSNLTVDCGTVGGTMTLVKVGLYDKLGNRLCVSAESSASFASTGTKTLPMILQSNGTPFVVPTDDLYFCAFLGVATTVPALSRGVGLAAGQGPGAVGVRAVQGSQTDLQASHTLAYNSGTAVTMWMGVS